MAAIAQTLPESNARFTWFWEWLKDELAPYPGRIALVARMVAAATVVMIITMTFRVPYGAYGVIFTLILSRESLKATATAVRAVSVGVILAGAYVVLGTTLVIGNETLHVLWVIGTFFLAFYMTSALRNYTPAAIRFGYLSVITVPLWDSHISADSKTENTLWAVGALTAASVMMLLLEIAFAAFRRTDDLTVAITERLICVQEMLEHYQDGRPVDASPRSHVAQLAMVGISRLRQMLWHSTYEAQRAQQLAAVVALVGRLTDIAANLAQFTSGISDDDRLRVARLACSVGEIRVAITSGVVPQITKMSVAIDAPTSLPLLHELEKTVSLIAEVFTHSQSRNTYALPEAENYSDPAPQFPGMLANTEHIKFGLRGCLAASCCYIIYNVLFWPEIATALTTCFVTALTTIGASHQKQFLRFAGALTGGIGIGIGAQVFVLPYIDSIGGFTVLFIAVIAAAAWIATSSPRLSYFGVQVAVAFCVINLLEFKIQTSLAVARDRVIGIVLGLFMMWLFFDHLWSAPAGVEMKRTFISNFRLLAQLAREPVSNDIRAAIQRTYALRESIDANLDKVRSLADGVLFEFGSSRYKDLQFRDQIRRWQPELRTLFVMRIASLKYRLQLTGFELSETVRHAQEAYDERSAGILEHMADRIEGKEPRVTDGALASKLLLEQMLEECRDESFAALVRGIDVLTTALDEEIAMAFESHHAV